MTKKLVIFGAGDQSEIADFLFTHDSNYEVVAFTAEKAYLETDTFRDRPLVDFDSIEDSYPPDEYNLFVAIGYSELNELRRRVFEQAKAKGYTLPSYVSSKATTWPDFNCGENCLILELNNIQPFVRIGDNVTLWSANHIGHHSIIEDDCFITSEVTISSRVVVGRGSFLGVNSTIRDKISIGKQCIIGASAYVGRKLADNTVLVPPKSVVLKKSSNDIAKMI